MGPGWPVPLPGHERLRRTGTYFENHHIAADMCSASRAVIYTGLHMPHNGIFDNAGVPYMKSLDPKLPTIGKILRKLGYYTAYKGKWHLNGAMAMENHANDVKALFETMMDRDYGFYDYTGTGDYIEGALGGYQYDQITSAQAAQWLKAKGRPMTDRRQPWYLAVNLVNPHDVMWVNTDLPGQPVQAKDAKLKIAFAPDDSSTGRNGTTSRCRPTWQQSLDAPGRVPAHRIYHEANGYLTGLDPQRGMARAQAPELLLQRHPRRRPADRPGPRPARPAWAHRQDHRHLHLRPRRAAGLAWRPVRQGHDGLPPAEPRADADRPSGDQGRPALPGDHVASRLRADHRRDDRQGHRTRRRHHGPHEGQGPHAAARQPVNPEFSRRAAACCSATASSWCTIPKFTQFLYETLHEQVDRQDRAAPDHRILPHRLVAARGDPQHHRRALQVQPLFLVPPVQHAHHARRAARQ